MSRMVAGLILLAMVTTGMSAQSKPNIMLVLHGGAGTITKATMTPEREREYREKLQEALLAGHAVLAAGGSSLDAVERSIRVMEDSPLFNAGKGSVFTHEGRNEMDASIMDGATGAAGAVGAVTIIRNPISAARAVMEKSEHVMLIGRGAELFATEQGLEVVDPSYFWTERRWKELQTALVKEKQNAGGPADRDMKFGTVGVAALDAKGNLAAGTSTGGRTNKRYGRVGDSPIIGAGTWADNATCAVSGTGHGEFFIRHAVAHEIASLMKHRGLSVQAASDEVIHKVLAPRKGEGGVIALDARGNFAFSFNSEGMYRGWIGSDGKPHVAIYKD